VIAHQEKYPGQADPRNAAKFFKLQTHKIPRHRYTDVFLWIDGSVRVLSPRFLSRMLDYLGDADIAVFKHHARGNIYQELEYVRSKVEQGDGYNSSRYKGQPLSGQVEQYCLAEFPKEHQLFELGIIIRRNTPVVNRMFDDWWMENMRWSNQDQLSFPYIYHRYKDIVKLRLITDTTVYGRATPHRHNTHDEWTVDQHS
jgi:hypothetical protein